MKYSLILIASLSFAQIYQVVNNENSTVSYRGLAFEDAKTFVVDAKVQLLASRTEMV